MDPIKILYILKYLAFQNINIPTVCTVSHLVLTHTVGIDRYSEPKCIIVSISAMRHTLPEHISPFLFYCYTFFHRQIHLSHSFFKHR